MLFRSQLGAHVAPEAFVLDGSAEILYRGRIDDWMYAVGKKRAVITTHELEDVLNEYVSRGKSQVKNQPAIGCIIE